MRWSDDNNFEYQKVTPTTDDDGHWFIIPSDSAQEFYNDLDNEEIIDSGEFGNKWEKYMTGGSLSNVELFVRKTENNERKD